VDHLRHVLLVAIDDGTGAVIGTTAIRVEQAGLPVHRIPGGLLNGMPEISLLSSSGYISTGDIGAVV
jgi:hypothetical protein